MITDFMIERPDLYPPSTEVSTNSNDSIDTSESSSIWSNENNNQSTSVEEPVVEEQPVVEKSWLEKAADRVVDFFTAGKSETSDGSNSTLNPGNEYDLYKMGLQQEENDKNNVESQKYEAQNQQALEERKELIESYNNENKTTDEKQKLYDDLAEKCIELGYWNKTEANTRKELLKQNPEDMDRSMGELYKQYTDRVEENSQSHASAEKNATQRDNLEKLDKLANAAISAGKMTKEEYDAKLNELYQNRQYDQGVRDMENDLKAKGVDLDNNTKETDNSDSAFPNGAGNIQFSQKEVGDCYFLASLKSVSEKHPEILEKSLKKVDDNTYEVTFPGYPDKKFVVTKSEIESEREFAGQDLRANSGFVEGDLGVKVYERAYAKFLRETNQDQRDNPDNKAVLSNNGVGGNPLSTLHLLTGYDSGMYISTDKDGSKVYSSNVFDSNSNPSFFGNFNNKKLNQDPLDQLDFNKYTVTADTASNNANNNEPTDDRIVQNHAYTVKNITKDSVEVINPWNTSETITLSREEFNKSFRNIQAVKDESKIQYTFSRIFDNTNLK